LAGKLHLAVLDVGGVVVRGLLQPDGVSQTVMLRPGTYFLRITGWQPGEAADLSYRIQVQLNQVPDNPLPLTLGPAPVQLIRLAPDQGPDVAPPPPAPRPPEGPSVNPQAGGAASAGSTSAGLANLMGTRTTAGTGPAGTSPTAALAGLSPDQLASIRFG